MCVRRDITSNCPPCACGVAALTPTCDVTTGRCACAAGALPPRCDECAPGFYQLTADGCIADPGRGPHSSDLSPQRMLFDQPTRLKIASTCSVQQTAETIEPVARPEL
ncbi:unnamed protein product [Plutella xylostella]|uniref:(diamondback moth) hypothetical protein n=1 Tax=Plutella xylostella TaxID=51655 RepID=A0A8S4F556_PLUXY|nr:unnamed protein product [Plutella xylostella]